MNLHFGNEFHDMADIFYKRFNSIVEVKDQLSYFLVLAKPDKGGELTVFNLKWNEKQENSRDVTNVCIKENGSKIYLNKDFRVQTIKLNLQSSDMILFQGGNLWHKVEPIESTKPRLTLGGFIAFSFDKQEVFYWS